MPHPVARFRRKRAEPGFVEAGLQGSFRPATIDGQQLLLGGDVIVAINGQTIAGFEDLSAFLQQAEPGQEAALTLLRNGNQVKVSVILGQRSVLAP